MNYGKKKINKRKENLRNRVKFFPRIFKVILSLAGQYVNDTGESNQTVNLSGSRNAIPS